MLERKPQKSTGANLISSWAAIRWCGEGEVDIFSKLHGKKNHCFWKWNGKFYSNKQELRFRRTALTCERGGGSRWGGRRHCDRTESGESQRKFREAGEHAADRSETDRRREAWQTMCENREGGGSVARWSKAAAQHICGVCLTLSHGMGNPLFWRQVDHVRVCVCVMFLCKRGVIVVSWTARASLCCLTGGQEWLSRRSQS